VRSAIDREAELEIRVAVLSDLRGRVSQGHQLVRPQLALVRLLLVVNGS